MLYISLLFGTFLLIFNYNYLLYVLYAYIFKEIINNCINNYYWMNSTELYLNIFGKIIYILHYIYYLNKNTYIVNKIVYIYNLIYNKLYYINYIIDFNIKKYTINYFFKKTISTTTKQINNIEIINILQDYLKLIKYIENININNNNEIKELLNESKIKINIFIKKNINKSNNILDDIKLYNNINII